MSTKRKLVHGGDIYSDRGLKPGETLLDFSANLNPLGMPEEVKTAAMQAVAASEAYPDPLCRKLRAAISEKEGIPEDQIICGNGAADLLFRLVWAVRPRVGAVPAPTFAEYESALRSADAEVALLPLSAENGFHPDGRLIEAVPENAELVFFCNPNNPTGISAPREFIRRLAEKCRNVGAILMVDECFLEFTDGGEEKSAVPLLAEFENLAVLKAFTKMYAMAGLRLGYLLCGKEALANKIAATGQAWSVSTPAQAAGLAALRLTGYPEKTREAVRGQREFLIRTLRDCGAEVLPGEANYLFFRWNKGNLSEQLLPYRILVRSCGNYHTLDDTCWRIAVRTEAENRKFAEALRKITEESK